MEAVKLERESNISHTIWSNRGKITCCSLVFVVLLSLLPWLADIATDLKVTVDHYQAGDKRWFILSLMMIVIPSLIVQVVSFLFHMDDKQRSSIQWVKLCCTHILQLGVLNRYINLVIFGKDLRSLEMVTSKPETRFYKSVVSQRNDLSIIGLLNAFLEDAPQLVLQLYIVASRGGFNTSSMRDIWVVISSCVSVFLFSYSVMNFTKWQRAGKEDSSQVLWYSAIVIIGWRLCMLVSRMISLVLFASVCKEWLFLFLFLHWVVMFVLFLYQKMELFPDSPWKQLFMRIIMAYMTIYCYFSIEGKQTRRWVITFYTIVFVENSCLFLIWYFVGGYHGSIGYFLLGAEWGSFVLGLVFMVVYYGCFHPNHTRPQDGSLDIDAVVLEVKETVYYETSV